MTGTDDKSIPADVRDPDPRDETMDLGIMQLHGKTAHLYACDRMVIARFVDPPSGTRAKHMHALTFESDVFLLAAFRLYLDRVGVVPLPDGEFVDVSEPEG